MNEELFARFRKCAVDVLSVDADKVTLEASFGDDLDADSLDLVELVMPAFDTRISTGPKCCSTAVNAASTSAVLVTSHFTAKNPSGGGLEL